MAQERQTSANRYLGEVKADFGNVPDWIAAIGTSGALIFVAVQHFRDRKRDRETTQQEQARQARLISVAASSGYNTDLGYKFSIGVQNDSGLLIRNLRAVVEDRASGAGQINPEWNEADYTAAVLEPGQRRDFQVPVMTQPAPRSAAPPRQRGKHLERTLRAGIEFTDAEGRRWLQLPDGNPLQR